MEALIRDILNKINSYSLNQIEIREYCKERMQERNVEETLLTTTLFSGNLYYVEEQLKTFMGKPEKRYKLVFKISSKYSLIIIVTFYLKILKVINVIKTSKGAEKIWRKKILK
jgi:hypothetical protein